jgi:CSLREA domain-containing protein
MRRIGCLVWILLGLWAMPARGAIFVAGSTSDIGDWDPGDGSCDTSPIVGVTICTLRAAIQEANALPGDDVIQLYGNTYSLNLAGADDDADVGDLDVTSTLRIEGSGVGATIIQQTVAERVFELPFLGAGNLTLMDLTLRGGDAGDDFGGGVFVNDGALTLDGVEITGCAARLGGGVFNYETATVVDSWIHGNHADWRGGGISSASTSASGSSATTLTMVSSTIGPNAAEAWPKEVELSNASSATLVNVTVSPSSPVEMSVEIANQNVVLDHVTIRGELTPFSFTGTNTLVVSNSAIEYCNLLLPSPLPLISRLGVNVSANAGCQFAAAGGIEAPLQLGALADNGGPTPTLLPITGSPLVDAADDARCAATDQRGVARPQDGGSGGGCDVGAVEGVPEAGGVAPALAVCAVLCHLRRRRC